MAKRTKIATRSKTAVPKAKAAARRRLAARKNPLKGTLKVPGDSEKSGSARSSSNAANGNALSSLAALIAGLPGWVIDAAAPAVRKTESAIGQIDVAKFIGAITAAMPADTAGKNSAGKKSAKRQIAEEAALLAAAVALIALRRKVPLMKIVGSGVPGNVLSLLSALRALRR